ncbi:MAG: hypothetical protein IT463_00835 [Planctomycetes bacterium]|nr:hypothetical protein [Planctomycetota bacterium]
MTADDIRRFAKADPFRPFIIRLSDGREFLVTSARSIWVPPSGMNCVVGESDGTAVLLDVESIASLQPREAA